MKVLLLASLNPLVNGLYYKNLVDFFEERKDVSIISIPFFAEIHAANEDKYYIPTLFSMFKTLHEDKAVNKKVLKGKHLLVVGNIYDSEKFDIIISLGDEEEENRYMEAVINGEKFKDFKQLAKADRLYSWDKAEINLPNIEKVRLFLEGAFKNDKVQ